MESHERIDAFEINEIDAATWQSMREQVTALVNANIPAEERQKMGNELLERISLYENRNMFKIDAIDDRFRKIEHSLHELRNLMTGSITNITGIIKNVAHVEDSNRKYVDRIAAIEEKLTIMENVNANFRKILTLENEFLRGLLKADNKTISNLRKKLQILRAKLEEISNRAGINQSNALALTETAFRNDETKHGPTENNCTAIQTIEPADVAVISELVSRRLLNQNILAGLQSIRNSTS